MASSDQPPSTARTAGSSPGPTSPSAPSQDVAGSTRSRGSSGASAGTRLRSASIKFLDSNPPSGMWHATGDIAGRAPTVMDIRHGNYGPAGWSNDTQFERRNSTASGEELSRVRSSRSESSPTSPASTKRPPRRTGTGLSSLGTNIEEHADEHAHDSTRRADAGQGRPASSGGDSTQAKTEVPAVPVTQQESQESATDDRSPSPPNYLNGYVPPPKHTWGQAFSIAGKGFWKFFLTPLGFLVTVYGLNVVAWGGMLFLLLCNAAPAMCHPDCNDINSPRRIWIEIDSQILNALFCVTGFGLVPWRFRDLFYLLKWRVMKRHTALQRLAGIHRGWFRLPGSDMIPYERPHNKDTPLPSTTEHEKTIPSGTHDAALPIPESKAPDPPPTGTRATPTAPWKLDFVIWMYVGNTFLQAVLSGFMWGLNRYDRPSWSTGLFVALACIVAGIGGLMVFFEGKRVKKFEGVPEGLPGFAGEEEAGRKQAKSSSDVEMGPTVVPSSGQ